MIPEHVWFRGLPEGGAKVERLSLGFDRLPEGLSGLRILFVSDVHAGYTFPEAAQRRLIDQIEGISPDVILWGGDFAETKEDARRLFGQIARLKPRLGMAGVAGNNDRRAFRGSMDDFRQLAERAGIKILINERRTIPAPSGELTILGLDEDFYGSPDPSILGEKGREAGISILLSHSPAPLEQLLNGRTPPDLILCGHTHGGQVRAGGLTLYSLGYEGVRSRQRFFTVRGLVREGGSMLVVSGGLGSSKFPLRINCPPEMQLITLLRDVQAPSF